MALQEQYSGSFVGVRGTVWRVSILVDGYSGSVAALKFPALKPLVIEWKETGKEEVLCGSTATLKIESPGDRTYTGLYTVRAGSVQLKVWRDDDLWWVGTLDPEFYEEPYERQKDYDVTLTFQDFGILGRMKFGGTGLHGIGSLLTDALSRVGLGILPVVVLTGTRVGPVEASDVVSGVSVLSSNMYDEDGDGMTLCEVLTGVLQPLGMRLVQRGGRIWLYDLDTLYNGGETARVVWSGSRQMLGVDRTANVVKVTWSPYAQSGKLSDGECWVTGILKGHTNLAFADGLEYNGNRYWTMRHHGESFLNDSDYADYGFTLWTSESGKGVELLGEGLRYFKTVPHQDGDEVEGVALVWSFDALDIWAHGAYYRYVYYYGYGVGADHGIVPTSLLNYTSGHGRLLRTRSVSLPPVLNSSYLLLRIKIDLLLDVRYNPYVEAMNFSKGTERAEKTMYDRWSSGMNFVCVPVRVRFDPADGGSPLYWRRDVGIWDKGPTRMAGKAEPLEETYGEWVTSDSIGWLMWYDKQDRVRSSGVLGWKSNRQSISPTVADLGGLFGMLGSGQYVPYPGTGGAGSLTIEILDHWYCLGTDGTFDADGVTYTKLLRRDGSDGYTRDVRWALMKLPDVEVLKGDILDTELVSDDVVYSGVINADAEDDVDIDTVWGTARYDRELARGIYVAGGVPVREFGRAGRTGGCEELLIGTLHSQWAERHVKLTGEMEEHGDGLLTYMESNQPGVKLMKMAEVMDAIGEVTEATLVELSPDEYDKA